MSEPVRRRRRPPLACILCRNRKIRCDRGTPCNNCLRSRNGSCSYDNLSSKPPQSRSSRISEHDLVQQPQHPTPVSNTSRESKCLSEPPSDIIASSTNASTVPSQPFSQDVEFMETRIRQLEEQLSKATQRTTESIIPSSDPNTETTTPRVAETFSVYKTRMYGKSHWFNGVSLIQDLFDGIEPQLVEDKSKAFSGIRMCKSLARVIKSQRAPQWPLLLQTGLPPKDIADELIDCYLRTTEAIYRILHVPSFRRDYDALWISNTEPQAAFLVQLKLVLSIGSIIYDSDFSMRSTATHWVHEAQNWLSRPEFKSQLNIQSLQSNILLLIAREGINVGGELIWISVGALFRTAVLMGLHRDPKYLSKRTTFAAEMRRRLWNTILEISLRSSMISGGPPSLSLGDFDTEPPRNFDDDQLCIEDPMPKTEDEFTQMSIAIALQKTFPVRLAITKSLNDLGPRGTYEKTLRLDTELRASYKILRRTLQGYSSSCKPSQFEIRSVDLLMNYFLSSLHIPYLGISLHETAYAFSRKVVIETALKIWYAAHPSSSVLGTPSSSEAKPSDLDDMSRFTICGSGFLRTVKFQASLIIAVELKTQVREDEGMGPISLRPDLLAVLDDAKSWTLQCIEAGETNMKCYLVMSIVDMQIKGLIQGVGKAELGQFLITATEEAEEKCLAILKVKAAQCKADVTMDTIEQMSLETLPQLVGELDFTVSDALFNFDDADPMGWLFNGETTQEAQSDGDNLRQLEYNFPGDIS